MNSEQWTTKTWLFLVTILVSIILFGAGLISGQALLGNKVQENEKSIIANTINIDYINKIFNEKLERIEGSQKIQEEKLDDISTSITSIETILENR